MSKRKARLPGLPLTYDEALEAEILDVMRDWPAAMEARLNNKFTFGRWKRTFTYGDLPCEFESCDWDWEHRGRRPAYWRYVKHSACHWLANFTLRSAMLVLPKRPWRIVTSKEHSTVWDGGDTLFDFNFQAFGIEPDKCFELAFEKQLKPGKYLRVHFAEHYSIASD